MCDRRPLIGKNVRMLPGEMSEWTRRNVRMKAQEPGKMSEQAGRNVRIGLF
jgi:hypothetical protein